MCEKKRQAVTGAFGFSGSRIARRLLEAGREVVTLTSSPGRKSPLQGLVKAAPFDFARPERMAESLAGAEVLYNTYWTRFDGGEATHAGAVRNSLAVFEAARLAGVRRVVHISVANADKAQDFSYYRAKLEVEAGLRASGLSYAIVRPALLFGEGGVLVNNMAWTLRRLPLFAMFGDGSYKLRPVYVDDLAALMLEQGGKTENAELYALGPETFTYMDLVRTLGRVIGCPRPVMRVPMWAGLLGSWFIGKLHGDVFATRDELLAMMRGVLDVPGAAPSGQTRFTEWAARNAESLGREYISEVGRRRDKTQAYI